jgi:hypothetical protein
MIQILLRALSRPEAVRKQPRHDERGFETPRDWTASDAAELRQFLNSVAGRSLGAAMRQWVAATAARAMRAEPGRLPWECGRAAGIQDAAAQLDFLAGWSADPDARASVPIDPDDATSSAGDATRRPDDDLAWLYNRQPDCQ